MIDDFAITTLDLSLFCYGGYGKSRLPVNSDQARGRTDRLSRPDDDGLPCLTLGLPDSTRFGPVTRADSGKFNNGSTPGSASSSFSDSFVKADKAEEAEAVEVGLGPVRKGLVVEDEDEGSPRKKLRLSRQQTLVLEEHFIANATLNGKEKQELASKLNLRPRQVEVWFQNRRARNKLKQTEADRELLRKCCETLKEDNARLKTELRRLKSTNHDAEPLASPVSVCPSCEISLRSPT